MTLDEIRAVALSLPRAHEGEVRGRVKFYIGQIVFVAMEREVGLMGFGFPKDFREAALEAEPDKFVQPRTSDLRYNWLVVRMSAIDRDEMTDLVTEAWSMCVPKKVLAAWMEAQR